MRKYKVVLEKKEREELETIIQKGSHRSQKVLNALVLLNSDQGRFQDRPMRNEDVSSVLRISMRKIDRVKRRFVEEGLDTALTGRKGERVYERKADGDFEAHVVALSCTDPPEGYVRWTLRLLADRAVELRYIDSISYETIRRLLKKRNKTLEKTRMGHSLNPPPLFSSGPFGTSRERNCTKTTRKRVSDQPCLPQISQPDIIYALHDGNFEQGPPCAPNHTCTVVSPVFLDLARWCTSKLHDSHPCLKEHSEGGMISCKTHGEFPCMFHDPSRKADEVKADCLHPLPHPRALENKVLHRRTEVVGKDHDRPPGGILSELARREPSSRKILFHDGMGLFGFAAPLMVPVNKRFSLPVHIGDETEEFVLGVVEGYCLKGKHVGEMGLRQLFPDREIAVGLAFLRRTLSVGDKTDFSPLAGDASLLVIEGAPLVCFTDRLLELRCHIRTDGELDPAETLMELPTLAPVAVGEKVMLIAGSVGTETDRLHPGREEIKGVEEDTQLFVSGGNIPVPELRMKDTSEFGPIGIQRLVGLVSLVGEEGFFLAGLYEGGVHVERRMIYGVPLMNGSNKVGIDLFESRKKSGDGRDDRRALHRHIISMKGGEIAEDRRRGRNRSMSLLSPPSLHLSSFLSREPLQLDPSEYLAEPFIGFKDAKVIDGLSSREVEQGKGHDDLLIRPTLYLGLEMPRNAFSQVEHKGKVHIDRKARIGGHAACRFLFFVVVREDALCHTDFTSLAIELVGRLILSSLTIRANEVFRYF